jgi:BirA family biotin operon repressor/biotin-[acetyl-CoA-carboxylase] ligase
LLFPLSGELSDAILLTSAAAVAVYRAILRVTGIETEIKWVNDLYLKGRKVCGILAESFVCGDARYVILGVGVNLYTEEFPPELSGVAGALLPAAGGLRNALAAAMLEELYAVATRPEDGGWLETYRSRSLCLGRAVTYTENREEFCGIAEEIDGRGRLWIRREDGGRVCLGSGEISLRINEQ